MKVGTSALEVLHHRIRRATSAGQSLHGMRFYEQFGMKNENANSLPRLYLVDYADDEDHAGGGSQFPRGINSILRITATLGFQLVTDMRNGWLTDDSVTTIKKMGIVNIKNMLLDEMEKDDAGAVDCSLNNTCDAPIMFSTRESGIFDLGVVMDITVTLPGIRFLRAERSCLVASSP